MKDALVVRLGRAGLRVPRALWRRIVTAEARQSADGIGWMQIAAGTGLGGDRVAVLTGELERGKTFLYRSDGINVDWAYPATAAVTPHRVRFASGEALYAA